jgi:hypothetical protein
MEEIDKEYERILKHQRKNIAHEIGYVKKLAEQMTTEVNLKNYRILKIMKNIFISSLLKHYQMLEDIPIYKETIRDDEISYGYDSEEGAWYNLQTKYKKHTRKNNNNKKGLYL